MHKAIAGCTERLPVLVEYLPGVREHSFGILVWPYNGRIGTLGNASTVLEFIAHQSLKIYLILVRQYLVSRLAVED